MPTDDVERVESLVPSKEDTIAVYCANADCSASPAAAEQLEQVGYTNAIDFEKGYAGWRQAGYPLVGNQA